MPDPEWPEEAVPGGLASAGRLRRVADTLRRPPGPHSAAVHAVLAHLAEVGFAGAPRWHGVDDAGRSIVDFVPGEVAMPPYPAWVASDDLLRSVAELQAGFHEAMRSFRRPPEARWDVTLAQPAALRRGDEVIVLHNDVSLENVVVRDGRAVALIDFDLAAPGERLWDVAIGARHWVPVRHPDDLDPARAGIDQIARWRSWLDAHRVPARDRPRVVQLTAEFLQLALARMRARAEAGERAYLTAWQAGYERRNLGAQAWLTANQARLQA